MKISGLTLHFYLGLILGILQGRIINPKSLANEKEILTEIRDTLNEILTGIAAPQ